MARRRRTTERATPYISLFTGAMGLDIGLERAGFKALVCNEVDPKAIETIQVNRPQLPIIRSSVETVTAEDLSHAAGKEVTDIDLVAGGPPCQAFSVFGQRRGIFDSRGKLIYEFIRLIDEIRPKVFLIENVRGLHSMSVVPASASQGDASIPAELMTKGSLLKEILGRFWEIGYRVDCYLVNAVNYGAPQIRERLLCIGNKHNLVAEFPEPRYSNRPEDCLPPFRTLGDVIGEGFEDPDPSVLDFSPRKLRYLSMVPPGGNWRSLPVSIQKESMGKSWYLKGGRSAYWRKLSYDFPSPTVVTMPNHAGTSMCHPSELRALTVGEMAAIQEFPREWRFAGSPTQKCRQIGNAVPPRLGQVAGEVILRILADIKQKSCRHETRTESRVRHIRPHVRTRAFYRNGQALAGNHCYYRREADDAQLPLFDKAHDSR